MFFNFLKRNKIKLISVCSIILIIVLVKLVLIDIVYVNRQYEKNRIATPWGEKIKSGNLSVDYSIDQTLQDISRLGLNTVNIPVEVNIPTLSSNTMMINPASEKKAIELIKKLRY